MIKKNVATVQCDFPGCRAVLVGEEYQEWLHDRGWEERADRYHLCPNHKWLPTQELLKFLEGVDERDSD